MSETKQEFFDKLNAEQKAVSIPYYLHEGEMFRLERLNKRWFIAFLIVLVMLFVTNGAWIIYENTFEDVTTTETYTATTEAGGNAVAYGTGGIYFNGESNLHENNQTAGEEVQQQIGD